MPAYAKSSSHLQVSSSRNETSQQIESNNNNLLRDDEAEEEEEEEERERELKDHQAHQHDDRQSSLSSASITSSDTENRASSMATSNADYDHIRNTTLMFFLDRLFMSSKDGVEVRTLHDLSCLFGTKGFTKEMRQIVGASRNGLKKFLQSYPSLFTIDGDQVYLTQLKQDPNHSSSRDYNKEAVEYFTQKLNQFGASLVPIKNLFGYRSQASQEVRHVSGKNAKEFRQFLAAHEDVFEILANEHVVLKSTLLELESRGETHASLQQTLEPNEETVVMDSYLNKQFAYSVVDCMKRILEENNTTNKEAKIEDSETTQDDKQIPLEYLHERILKECCNNQSFLKMVKTIDNLKVFLRMHPRLFKRYKCQDTDYVRLVTEEEKRELDRQAYPNFNNQSGSLRKGEPTTGEEDNLNDSISAEGTTQPMSLPVQVEINSHRRASSSNGDSQVINHRKSQATCERLEVKDVKKIKEPENKQLGSCMNSQSNSSNKLLPNSQQQQYQNNSSSLRATAPPFIPSTHLQQSNYNKTAGSRFTNGSGLTSTLSNSQPPTKVPIVGLQRSFSNLTSSGQRKVIDPRVSLRSYLIKASASNTNNSLYSPYKPSNGAQTAHQSKPNNLATTLNPTTRNNHQLTNSSVNQQQQTGDDLRARTVNIVREASNIITRVMTSADAVAFDCKGYNLGFNGQVTLIQFAFLPKSSVDSSSHGPHSHITTTTTATTTTTTTENNNQLVLKQKPEVCIFDLITNPELAYCLKPLLESEQIVKIVHDVRNKSNALYNQFGIMLNHVFDTQVANLVIQQQETGKPAYKSRYISMNKLCEIYGDDYLMKYRNSIKSKTRHATSLTGNSNHNSSKIKDVNYWRTRPLNDAMVYESTMDVYCLVGGVYQNLKAKIKPEYEPLFEELNLEGVLARIKPDEIRSVKKERKIDLEVIDLKRKLYSSVRSIVLSNREIRLLRHIDLTEEVRSKIQQCKKVAKKLERLDMKAAQIAQLQTQSLNSQVSSDQETNNQDQSIDANTSFHSIGSNQTDRDSINAISLGNNNEEQSASNNDNEDDDNQQKQQQYEISFRGTQAAINLCSADDLGMTNLMDSSMFDELKDKMIESSSLLESLAYDEDDDVEVIHEHYENNQLEHSSNHDNCTCNCHHKSSGSTDGDKTNQSLRSISSRSTEDHEDASVESRAVDMAVQCDLLS